MPNLDADPVLFDDRELSFLPELKSQPWHVHDRQDAAPDLPAPESLAARPE